MSETIKDNLDELLLPNWEQGHADVTLIDGTYVANVAATFSTAISLSFGLSVGIHMTEEQARDLLHVLQEALDMTIATTPHLQENPNE